MRKNLVASTLAIALASALSPGNIIPSAAAQATAPGAAIVTPNRYGLPDFGDLVEQVGPAVVNISVNSNSNRPAMDRTHSPMIPSTTSCVVSVYPCRACPASPAGARARARA